MDTVKIHINGQFVHKSSKNASAAGSANTCALKFIFDESWTGFAKRVIWKDSKGENETSVLLVSAELEESNTYDSYIPASVTKTAGWCSFTVEGYYASSPEKVMKSVSDALFVSYSEENSHIIPITPNEAMQLHSEFEGLMPKVEKYIKESMDKSQQALNNFSLWEEFNIEKLYLPGNKVYHNGCSYICIKEVQGVSPENEQFWLMIASRGDRGEKGNCGPQGIQGEKGDKGDKGEKGETGDKGDKGEKGDKGDRGINGSCVPANGFYTFFVDENGDLWLNCPDNANIPDVKLNENGELILSVGENANNFNVGTVKGDAFKYSDFTPEQKQELLKLAIPEIGAVNEAATKAMESADNALVSEQNAAESEEKSASSQKSAEQALGDLLAMINSGNIVLATNGKLPLSAIPATATQEIYVVESEDNLTSLNAQRGDLAQLIEEIDGEQTITKTWQCLGDSSIGENWVVWGTSYAVQAGQATYADNAGNSAMINGHRIVEMTQEEFSAAVKDEDTYYLVY